jgi:hypothetical protein
MPCGFRLGATIASPPPICKRSKVQIVAALRPEKAVRRRALAGAADCIDA